MGRCWLSQEAEAQPRIRGCERLFVPQSTGIPLAPEVVGGAAPLRSSVLAQAANEKLAARTAKPLAAPTTRWPCRSRPNQVAVVSNCK